MRRREVVGSLAALAAAVEFGAAALGSGVALAATRERVRPGKPGWPSDADWAKLGEAMGGRLEPVKVPDLDAASAAKLLRNPFYLGDTPAFTESSGWVDAWQSAPSAWVVKAQSAADVAAAVRFAAERRLRLVIRGGGHSYFGTSQAPDSLLVWLRHMDAIDLHDAFTPQGCGGPPVAAVSLGPGVIWGRAYDAVTNHGGRYVQGGGCTTVGVSGLVQGGGFGSYSKGYGMAAASLIEAEVVTADGRVRIANACREPDLFWALKGGGGGTFGVVTRFTLATHPLPANFGHADWTVEAASDTAFRALLGAFADTYAAHLFNPHWGEQAQATPGNRLVIDMAFQGVGQAEARTAWQDLEAFVAAHPGDYKVVAPLSVIAIPPGLVWNGRALHGLAPGVVSLDDRPGANPNDFWWTGDGVQAGAQWHGYASAWLPAALLQSTAGRAKFADAWFAASRHWSTGLHFNKGLAGAAPAALAASRDTATNPEVLDAFALAIIGMLGPSSFPEFPRPDPAYGRANARLIAEAIAALRAAAPGAGSYLNECDYFLEDWGRAQWGEHYPRLRQIKRRYDPDGLFVVHHGVGSEAWSADGFTRVG
jgi:FAD/FMN-containing dehydrogenase